jgi:hypothetical protein
LKFWYDYIVRLWIDVSSVMLNYILKIMKVGFKDHCDRQTKEKKKNL